MADYRAWYMDVWQNSPAANKNLGQHFIYDFDILLKIAGFADIASADQVIEIGPGRGGLTAAILQLGAKKLYAVEKDATLAQQLNSLTALAGERLSIIQQDARKVDMAQIEAHSHSQNKIIIANLPYNVGTFLLNLYLDQAPEFTQMVLMFQREVGCRLVARPHSGEYGRLSVLAQARAEIRTAMVLPPGAFQPAPKIASSVIKFTMRDLVGSDGSMLDYPALKQLTSILFAQRRKKIQTVLAKHGVDKNAWHDAPVDGELRPEAINPADFIALTKWVINNGGTT